MIGREIWRGLQVGFQVAGLQYLVENLDQRVDSFHENVLFTTISSIARCTSVKANPGLERGLISQGLEDGRRTIGEFERWMVVGDLSGHVHLVRWPCLPVASSPSFASVSLSLSDQTLGPDALRRDTWAPHESAMRNISASGSVNRGIGRLCVSSGDIFVIASSTNQTSIFQWRYILDLPYESLDPHVRNLIYNSMTAAAASGACSILSRGTAPVWQGPSVVPLLRDRQAKEAHGRGNSVHIGPPAWMKELTIEGREADRRLGPPDKGLQPEMVFGCDTRGMACCAMVKQVEKGAKGWLGDVVWFSGSIAIVHNVKSGRPVSQFSAFFPLTI